MLKPILFKSAGGNQYAYHPAKKQMGILHPLVSYFHSVSRKNGDPGRLLEEIRVKGSIDLEGYGTFSYKEASYQMKKYRFLLKKGYLQPRKRINLEGKLQTSDIEGNIPHLKQIIFEVTEDCNLSCVYCAYSKFYSNQERSTQDLDLDKAKQTLRYFIERRQPLANKSLTISFYGGEPLKNIRVIQEIVSFVKSIPGITYPLKFSMTSNGLLLRKYLDFLMEHNFDVGISLDGDRDSNRYRVTKNNKASFDIVIRNLEHVRKNYPAYFDKHINFLSVLHNRNTFATIQQYFEEKYHKTSLISDISTSNLNEAHVNEFREVFLKDKVDDRNEVGPMKTLMMRHPRVRDMADMFERYSGMVFRNHYDLMSPDSQVVFRKKFVPTATCSPFSMRTFMTTDGTILPCEHISREFVIGHAERDSVTISPEGISNLFNGYYEKIKKFCDHCYLVDNCKECVFNTRIETDKPSCDFFMSERSFRDYLARNYSIIEDDYPFFLTVAKHAFQEKEK